MTTRYTQYAVTNPDASRLWTHPHNTLQSRQCTLDILISSQTKHHAVMIHDCTYAGVFPECFRHDWRDRRCAPQAGLEPALVHDQSYSIVVWGSLVHLLRDELHRELPACGCTRRRSDKCVVSLDHLRERQVTDRGCIRFVCRNDMIVRPSRS